MTKSVEADVDGDGDSPLAVDVPVIVFGGTEDEMRGVVVEDFGDTAGTVVDVAGQRIAEAARRWAVNLDDGRLVFVDSASLTVAGDN
jgi:hypothetical protein